MTTAEQKVEESRKVMQEWLINKAMTGVGIIQTFSIDL